MRFPDGRVILFDVKRTSVEVTERELVKCKNCIYSSPGEGDELWCTAGSRGMEVEPDGWCWKGDKKG